ncbi:MAG: CPBP family intramembrane glutamic endopeptidase [Bacteroidales bacterium]
MKTARVRNTPVLRTLEWILLFFGVPLIIYLDRDITHPTILILPALVFIFVIMKKTTDFSFRELVRWNIPRHILARNGVILLVCLLLMLGYVGIFEPGELFNLPRRNPWVFVAMCFFYPVFSAYGQEIIYRTFIFRRYRNLFTKKWPFILASGVSFSFLHIAYYDPVSMVLTFIGGIYLAQVYWQTRSVLFTTVLHGVLGIIVFGVGLGQYFWLDMPLNI